MTFKPSLVTLAIISIFIFVGVYCPIIAYNIRKTKQYEDRSIIKKRNSKLTIALSSISICWILSFVLTILIYCFNDTGNNTIGSLAAFLVIAIYLCFTYILIWRLWLQYYSILHAVSLLKNSWQKIIHPEAAVTKNWYIQTQQSWGNQNYLKKRMLLFMISHIFLYALVYFININIILNFIVRLILIVAPWIWIYAIYKRIPKFHDEIGISEEIKYVMIGYSLMGILFILLFIILAVYTSSKKNEESSVMDALFGIAMHLIAAITFLTTMCITWYPLKKYVYTVEPTNDDSGHLQLLHIQLEEIMCSMDAIDLLMKWVQKEYSQENLLFVIEITLFQSEIVKFIQFNHGQPQLKKYDINLHELNQKLMQIPTTCPQSSIVEEEYEDVIDKYGTLLHKGILPFVQREQIRFKHAAYLLFEKYIIVQSDLAVNISGVCRNILIEAMENYDNFMKNKSYDNIEKLFYLFENAKDEIKALINGDSISRLRRSHDDEDKIYQKIENIFSTILSKTQKRTSQLVNRSSDTNSTISKSNKP
eukprot:327686_1